MKKELTFEQLVYSEQFILAAALNSSNTIADIVSRLGVDDFLTSEHKLIYQAILDLNNNSKSISAISVADYLGNINKLEKSGGRNYIYDISASFFTDQGLEAYIDRVHTSSIIRKINNIIVDLDEKRKDPYTSYDEILKIALNRLLEIDLSTKQFEIEFVGDVAKRVIQKIRDLELTPNSLTGVPTGFRKLDNITLGWQESDFIILAARPSVGKTAFSLNLAYNAAAKGYAVAFFSLEMPSEQLTQRLFSRIASVESSQIRSGKGLDQNSWTQIILSGDRLAKTPIYIDPTPNITIQQIRSKLYKLKRDYNVRLCIIDYLQLIESTSPQKDKQSQIVEISRQLKQIARQTKIPIICLSQLSRKVESREDKRPMMSDLRDSGAIEQDADVVMFLYRDDYYNKDINHPNKEKTELIIAKHRNGATGSIDLKFTKNFGRFMDWE